MAAWGDRWLTGPEGTPLVLHHTTCDHDMQAVVVCSECWQPLDVHDVKATAGPGHPGCSAGARPASLRERRVQRGEFGRQRTAHHAAGLVGQHFERARLDAGERLGGDVVG